MLSESDYENDSELERASSVSSTPDLYETVPEDTEFKFKLYGKSYSKSGTKFVYTLKEGRHLPYDTRMVTNKGTGTY